MNIDLDTLTVTYEEKGSVTSLNIDYDGTKLFSLTTTDPESLSQSEVACLILGKLFCHSKEEEG